jgi:MFS family permease
LLAAYSANVVGQTFGIVALSVAVFQQTDSPAWVAAVNLARLSPYVVLPGVGGVVADRVPRKVLLTTSAALRAALIGFIGIAVAAGASPFVLVILAFAFTLAGTANYPALAAAVPSALPIAELAAGNALLTSVASLAFVVGPALGGLAVALTSPAAALGINAFVFLVALLLCTRLSAVRATVSAESREPLLPSVLAGARAIVSSGDVAAPVLLVVVVNVLYGGALVGLVVVAEDLLHTGAGGVGLLNAAFGVGACIGVASTNWLARRGQPLSALAVTTLLCGVPFALLAAAEGQWLALLLMAVAGAGGVLTEIFAITLVQRAVPTEVLARVFSVLDSLLFGATLLGSIIAPVLIGLVGIRWSLVFVGAVVPGTAVLVASRLHAAASRADAVGAALAPRVELLRALPWLRGTFLPTLEALAAYSTMEEVNRGGRIIEEWDEPDDFYVVVDGTVEVRRASGDGSGAEDVINVLGPGAGFGELGLLQRVPRTASVVAREQVQLLRVDGDLFVAAVNAVGAAGSETPGSGILARLGGGGAAEIVDERDADGGFRAG